MDELAAARLRVNATTQRLVEIALTLTEYDSHGSTAETWFGELRLADYLRTQYEFREVPKP